MLLIRRVAPSRWMQLNLITLVLVGFGLHLLDGVTTAWGEDSVLVDQRELTFEPYSVYVATSESHARCGPSAEYYRTDPLRQGQELQVYAETDDGWLGIRPPEDSFCWVPAETVQKDSGALDGVIIEDRTVAWIGTHLGRARTYRWQVQLAEGEPVTVIGRSEREGPDGPQLWYRIVPPSGEYRWVKREDVVTSSEDLVALMRRSGVSEDVKVFPRDRPVTDQSGVRPEVESSSRRTAMSDRERDRGEEMGPSVLARTDDSPVAGRNETDAVGSGLNEQWRDRDGKARNVRAVAFSRSRQTSVAAVGSNVEQTELLAIGEEPVAPAVDQQAAESNWVAANSPDETERLNLDTPPSLLVANLGPSIGNFIARATGSSVSPVGYEAGEPSRPQLSGQRATGFGSPSPVMQAAVTQVGSGPVLPASKTLTYISSERLAQIELEVQQADVEQLGLVFSRLMAARATAMETSPVARAAHRLMTTSQDPLAVGRARMLLDRVEQYQRVAQRRDGEVVVRDAAILNSTAGSGYPVLQASHTQSTPLGSNAGPLYQGPAPRDAAKVANATGTLVQVYSARTNSPPFALTDNSGRTIAYVTPIPGVNLRPHLNHRVSIFGNRGFLTGLSTAHIVATQAVRAQ